MAFNPLYASGLDATPGRPINLRRDIGAALAQLPPADPLPPTDPFSVRDRVVGAVESFGANLNPQSPHGVEAFFGSAARGFAGVQNYLAMVGGQRQQAQERREDRDLQRRNVESQILERERPGQVNAPRFGADDWIPDPQDPTAEVLVSKDPRTGELSPQTFNGQTVRRPRRTEAQRPNEPGGQFFGLQEAGALRREFGQRVERQQIIADNLRNVRVAAEDPSAAGDLSLIFSYMRMLDPSSTVREGEFANAQNAAGVPDQIRNLWNRAQSGERLNPNQRRDFVRQAENLGKEARRRVQAERERYDRIARQSRLRPEDVTFDPFEGLISDDENPYR